MHQITIPTEASLPLSSSLLAVIAVAALAIAFYIWHFTRPTGGLG